MAAGAAPAAATTLTVNTTVDELKPGDGLCSVREAIEAVNSGATPGSCAPSGDGAYTVVLRPGRYLLTIAPAGSDDNASGDLNMTASATIAGAGEGSTIVDAAGLGDRVLDVASGPMVTLSDLTITGGHAPDGSQGSPGVGLGVAGAPGGPGANGGGIQNGGSLTLRRGAVTSSSAGNGGGGGAGSDNLSASAGAGGSGGSGGAGGGIYNTGTLTVIDSTINANKAGSGGAGAIGGKAFTDTGGDGGAGGIGPEDGGGIATDGGTVTITGSTITGNSAGSGGDGGSGGEGAADNIGGDGGSAGSGSWGGGVSGLGAIVIATNSTISSNFAGAGGNGGAGGAGQFKGGNGGNGGGAGNGGGVRFTSTSSFMTNVTIAYNGLRTPGAGGIAGSSLNTPGAGGAGGGSGVGAGVFDQGTAATLQNTIVATNVGGNCGAGSPIIDDGDNLQFADTTCPAGFATGDPRLGPLQDNGGPTQTIALGPGSAAKDRIAPSGADCPATDQRGVLRPSGSSCDIGAYEVAPPTVSTGLATAISAAGATLTGTVTPNAADASAYFQIGTTTTYGLQTATQHIGGVSATAVPAVLSGLSANTTYHYRVVATSMDGTTVGSDRTFTTSAVPSPRIANLTSLSETYSVFAVGGASTPLTGQTAKRHHKGTVFSFRLDQAATVKITIQTTAPGRRVGRSCRANNRKLRRKPRCTRTITIATLTRSGHVGLNKVAFSGRIRGKALKPGRYKAVFTAMDAAGASAPRGLSFTIVRR